MSQSNGSDAVVLDSSQPNIKGHTGKRWPFQLEYDSSRTRSPWWTPFLSVFLALVLCSIFIAANGMNPITVYEKMFRGAFGTSYGFTETIVKAIPLLLCGLGIAIAYRISIWNIGAEGQFTVGAMGATAVTIYFPGLPTFWSLLLMILFGFAAGAIWGLMTAVPRTHFGVNELITSLMLNYVALLALDYVVFGPWKDPEGFNFPGSSMFTAAQSLPVLGSTRLHLGIVFGLVAVLIYYLMIRFTRWGYELRLIGANSIAAHYAGIHIKRHIIIVMLISGGLAGIAGMAEVSGVTHKLMQGISPGYGYTAIIVAWLAKLNPIGLIVTSVLFGGLIVGGYSVQTIGLPSSISEMLQGSILFFVIAGDMIHRFRVRRNT
ncbi:ABC transporter permease [Paenibacillus crassostreae]|uniref:ABC transporter permease n=1 Tax=Paenibacillus crassostreae TaxID=1763538 RepID=A0A167B544_9BACL|nr:ABC transporter permease [Paenibacillus crassostreae]AOZ93163.1 ABC transporter permease [Paenibacillus crassostreae]OAB71746.1 ABC transporter permease [Paenibacillus crassostreae]